MSEMEKNDVFKKKNKNTFVTKKCIQKSLRCIRLKGKKCVRPAYYLLLVLTFLTVVVYTAR